MTLRKHERELLLWACKQGTDCWLHEHDWRDSCVGKIENVMRLVEALVGRTLVEFRLRDQRERWRVTDKGWKLARRLIAALPERERALYPTKEIDRGTCQSR